MEHVVKEWAIGGHGVYTQGAEVASDVRTLVRFADVESGKHFTHEFPADFIRPVLEAPDLLNALMHPDFCFLNEREWHKIVTIINMFYHHENPRELQYVVKPGALLCEWYYKTMEEES